MNKKIIAATPFGSVTIIWAAMTGTPKIVRVLLSKPDLPAEHQVAELYSEVQASSCPEIDAVAGGIIKMLKGQDVDFPLDLAALSLCSSFQQLVLRAEHAIPRGRVSTYRLIAHHLGKTNGARAVGNALAKNPFPLIVPCHRVIRSDRSLGGYQGGPKMKRVLLEREGVLFDDEGKVKCLRLHYEM
jgi:methylated-DNA-[protein]-cysteine S-methyltransferase